MQNNDDNGFLNDRFEGYSAAPTDQLWGNIADALETKPKKKRGFIWWWMGAGLAAAVGLGYVSINQITHNHEKIDYLTRATENNVTRQKVFIDNQTTLELNEHAHRTENEAISEGNGSSRQVQKQTDKSSTSTIKKSIIAQNIVQQELTNEALDQKNDLVFKDKEELISFLPIQKPELLAVSFPDNCCAFQPNLEMPKKGTWEWGLSINSWHAFNGSTPEDNAFIDVEIMEDFTDISPELSIRKNLGIRGYLGYHINERFRLYSGLQLEATRYRYSGLITGGFPSSSEIASFSTNQLRHYSFGVPIGAEIDMIDRKKFSFAIGLDFINELTFHERYKPYYDANYAGAAVSGNSSLFHYRAALGAHLNLDYHINSNLRINFRPGLRSYFGGPSYETFILPNRQLWWGGSIGFIRSF